MVKRVPNFVNVPYPGVYMRYKVWGNIPDQDHIRSKILIGECNTIEESESIIKECINRWKGTSNYLRLQKTWKF